MVTNSRYEYGTSPRKLDNPARPKTTKKTKKKVKVNNKKVQLHKFKVFSLIAIGFTVMFTLCYRYSLINQKFNDIQKLKKEYVALQTANDQIQINIQNGLDLTSIERHAKDKLGMQKPEANQIKYIDIEKEDKVVLNDEIIVEENIFQSFWGNIAKLLD